MFMLMGYIASKSGTAGILMWRVPGALACAILYGIFAEQSIGKLFIGGIDSFPVSFRRSFTWA